MKRVEEKVKDIVEVCPFTHLHDFNADPGLTLSSYHFTDITSELMAKWIDVLGDVKPGHGSALALAGFRGVGKSHFLAVLAAIVSNPELRSRIRDQHVAAAVDTLSRRHTPVAFVKRGSGLSLLDELKNAIAAVLGCQASTLSDSLSELLLKAADLPGDLPLVLLIDTALNRDTRVSRDDGALLGEIADAARSLGIFVGVALDDDISGADGPNSAIAGNFTIDYLDQEHLYKIVDKHIFTKHSKMLPVLREIYQSYRSSMPGFRWSEQRFSSLYPLHPVILEIAPVIRLYIHDFALLGFASEAGVKIMGRPANSLIGLDEVFDGIENRLRGVSELKEIFAAFDQLHKEVVSKTPVHHRLEAKLILKGFLLLALDGQGATAAEIGASMMIVGEQAGGAESFDVGGLLDSFAEAVPEMVERIDRDELAPKYSIKLSAKTDVQGILTEAARQLPATAADDVLLKVTSEKFAGPDGFEVDGGVRARYCEVAWRGAIRRGQVIWNAQEGASAPPRPMDWVVIVDTGSIPVAATQMDPSVQSIFWKTAALTSDEKDTIRRHQVLQSDVDVREKLGEAAATAAHVHSMAVEKIWHRVFLEEGILVEGGREYLLDASSHDLVQILEGALAPIFGLRFPAHPEFPALLEGKQVSELVRNFFGGAGPANIDTQLFAETYALPLGLASMHGDICVAATDAELTQLPVVTEALLRLPAGEDAVVPLTELWAGMQAAPYGLSLEARQLAAVALVSQRQFEFVTSSGDRINHKSLDLQIIWGDIVGLARPLQDVYSTERLLVWAGTVSESSDIKTLTRPGDTSIVVSAVAAWLEDWAKGRVLERFDALPDEALSAAIWKTAAGLRKTYSAMAEMAQSLVNGDLPLDQFLQSIADLFSDSEAEFERKKAALKQLTDFIDGSSRRAEMINYISLAETTDDANIEDLRRAILGFGGKAGGLDDAWSQFHKRYADHYAARHEAAGKAVPAQALTEMLRSDPWRAFESVSTNPLFDAKCLADARALIREIRQSYCVSDVTEALKVKPFCTCSFTLAAPNRTGILSEKLKSTIMDGLKLFWNRLQMSRDGLIAAADTITARDGKKDTRTSLKRILDSITDVSKLLTLDSEQLRLLKLAAENMPEPPAAPPLERRTQAAADEPLDEIESEDDHEWEPKTEELEAFANL